MVSSVLTVCVFFQRRTSRVTSSVTAASHMEEGQGPQRELKSQRKMCQISVEAAKCYQPK